MNKFEATGRVSNLKVFTTKTNKTFYVFDLINEETNPYSSYAPQVNRFPCIKWGALKAAEGDSVYLSGEWTTKIGKSKAGKDFQINQVNVKTLMVESAKEQPAQAAPTNSGAPDFGDDIPY